MSTILLIEPDKMLRQAFTIALFPEHQVQVAEALTGVSGKFDTLIVDAVALQERKGLSTREIRTLASSQMPMIWIDGEQTTQAPKRDGVVQLRHPVTRDALLQALARCLVRSSALNSVDALTARSAEARIKAKPKVLEEASVATSEGKKFIDLVDVVEEETAKENPAAQLK